MPGKAALRKGIKDVGGQQTHAYLSKWSGVESGTGDERETNGVSERGGMQEQKQNM